MINAGITTRRNGRMGEIMLVPATVDPFFPIPPLLIVCANFISTNKAVVSENDAIRNQS
jgi:hypothetical protein